MFKEERNKHFSLTQIVCDSQGCRKVDLFGRPVNDELKTLMSSEQLKELADRTQIQCSNEHSEDERTLIEKMYLWLEDNIDKYTKAVLHSNGDGKLKEKIILTKSFKENFEKAMKE